MSSGSSGVSTAASLNELDSLIGTRGTVIGGYLVVAVFLLIFIFVGGSVPLSTAAIAQGIVGVEGHKKQIQHLEGGIVSDILVRDGDFVEAGQVLVALNGVDVESKFNELNNQQIQTGAELSRWMAEYRDLPDLEVPEWLRSNPDTTFVANTLNTQRKILQARRAVLAQSLTSLAHKLKQNEEKVAAAKEQIATLGQKNQLINAELGEYRRLEKMGLVTRNQLFDLKKQRTNLKLEIESAKAEISQAATKKEQLNSEIAEVHNASRQESVEQSTLVRNKLESLKQQIASVSGSVSRLNIRSPITGYVINSTVNTRGGIIASGQPIMEIVPKNERLLIESRLAQKDRDSVEVGQRAEVRFSAFNRRSTLPVGGSVKLISADSIMDPVTGTSYYNTTIELQQDPAEVLGGSEIHPGMQANVIIVTGEQTFLQYLSSPIVRSFNRAFREE